MKKRKIGNNIRRFRFDNNEMTQQELASKIGVTRQAILSIDNLAMAMMWTYSFWMKSAVALRVLKLPARAILPLNLRRMSDLRLGYLHCRPLDVSVR